MNLPKVPRIGGLYFIKDEVCTKATFGGADFTMFIDTIDGRLTFRILANTKAFLVLSFQELKNSQFEEMPFEPTTSESLYAKCFELETLKFRLIPLNEMVFVPVDTKQ